MRPAVLIVTSLLVLSGCTKPAPVVEARPSNSPSVQASPNAADWSGSPVATPPPAIADPSDLFQPPDPSGALPDWLPPRDAVAADDVAAYDEYIRAHDAYIENLRKGLDGENGYKDCLHEYHQTRERYRRGQVPYSAVTHMFQRCKLVRHRLMRSVNGSTPGVAQALVEADLRLRAALADTALTPTPTPTQPSGSSPSPIFRTLDTRNHMVRDLDKRDVEVPW